MNKLFLVLSLFFISLTSEAKLSVVTTTSDLAYLVKVVAAEKADVFSVAKGTQDPHQIEAKPSFMVKMRNADLVIAQGLELESAWIIPLIQGSRNNDIAPGTKGFLELGDKLNPIEIPKASATRADGDVHPGGNPHFQLDPIRMGEAGILIAKKMSELDSANAKTYEMNAQNFKNHMEEKTKEWKARIEKTGVKEVVTYHKTLTYFLNRFSIQGSAQLEPRPGIPPTAKHLMEVIKVMKEKKINLVLIENFFDSSISSKIKESLPSAKVVLVPVAVDGAKGMSTTEDVIENLVKVIENKI